MEGRRGTQEVLDTLRRARGLAVRLREVQEKLSVLQRDSQRALDDEDDTYNDDLRTSLQSIQQKLVTALEQHRSILDNLQLYQNKQFSNEVSPDAELVAFVVSQTHNAESIVTNVEHTLEELSPYSIDWIPEPLVGWKDNLAVLYDTFISYDLDSPSFACAWGGRIADSSWKNNRFGFQKLLLSRSPDSVSDSTGETRQPCTLDVLQTKLPSLRVFDEKKLLSSLDPKKRSCVPYKSRIVHPGVVHRIKTFPMLPDIVVTVSTNPELYVWNSKTQPDRSLRPDVKPNDPDVILLGHQTTPSFGLDVHASQPLICSSSENGVICVWSLDDDVTYDPKYPASRGLGPRAVIAAHEGAVEDIIFHPINPSQLCSAGVDMSLKLWDLRSSQPSLQLNSFHSAEITTLSWNRHIDHLLLSGCSDGYIKLLDLRKPESPVSKSQLHSGSITNLQWCPNHLNVFASSATDHKMYICDSQLINSETRSNSFEDGLPSEVLFSHEGHLGEVVSFEWNTQEPLMIASLCDRDAMNGGKSTVQIWRPSDYLFMDRQRFISMVRELS